MKNNEINEKPALSKMAVSGSVLIAKYLGWKVYDDGETIEVPNLFPFYNTNDEHNTGWTTCKVSKTEFHNRWDWIMFVVEKICKEKYQDGDTAYIRTLGMISQDFFMVRINRHQLFMDESLIMATYLSVCDFLRNHNQTDR